MGLIISSEPVGDTLVLVGGVTFHNHPPPLTPFAMDPWKEYAALEECRDTVRRWAELEGKSPQMTEDLARGYAHRSTPSVDTSFLVAASMRVLAWALETWWYITRR